MTQGIFECLFLNYFHICQLITQGSTNGKKLQKEVGIGRPTCHLHDILQRSQGRDSSNAWRES
jgi:hypothetical protein